MNIKEIRIEKGDYILYRATHIIILLLLFFSIILTGCIDFPEDSKVWYVNQEDTADFIDIQTAVDYAGGGDIINVAAGIYRSSINITKSLSIISEENARIIGNDSFQPLVIIHADTVLFSGFTIENGTKGMHIFGNNCTITSNIIKSNTIGIDLVGDTENNVIFNNYFENDVNIVGSGNAEFNIPKRMEKNIIGGSTQSGNYWSDYLGFDVNDDGIGDTELPYGGGMDWVDGGDWFPLTNRSQQPEVFVDDDFTFEKNGWGITHFSSLEHAIMAAKDGGMIYIAQGEYEGPLVLNKSLILIGEQQEKTIIRTSTGLGYGTPIIQILQPNCFITNLTIMASSNVAGRVGIDGESQNTTIKNVTIQGFEYGIRFLFVLGGNTVTSTNIINCNTGIYSSYTKNNILINNIIQNCTQYGIYLNAGSDENLIEHNILRGNEYAMRIKGSTLNLISNNILSKNNKGVYFCCGARNNTVTRNRFIDSVDWHASDQYRNIWDKNSVGNYWDDYVGYDQNSDGIGDMVYEVSAGYSVDRFPIIDLSYFDNLSQ